MDCKEQRAVEFVIAAGLSAVLLWLLFPPSTGHRRIDDGRYGSCKNSLKCIGLALHTYHETYGSFPPAYLADENGEPMHSWRVLLLPFLDGDAFYNAYRFDEPWDGPHNSSLHARAGSRLGDLFSCAGDSARKDGNWTSYLAVVGPETAWPGVSPRTRKDFRDGLDNTLMVVEVHESGIHWMEPRDLEFDKMCFGVNDNRKCGIRGGGHERTDHLSDSDSQFARVLYADGVVQDLFQTTPAHVVRALLTADGGEAVQRP